MSLPQKFPPSIVPPGEKLEPTRPMAAHISSLTIEVFHVFCFIALVVFISGVLFKAKCKSIK